MLGLQSCHLIVTTLKLPPAESCGPEGTLQILAGRRSLHHTQVTPTATVHSVCMTAVQCHFAIVQGSVRIYLFGGCSSSVQRFDVVAVSRLQTVRPVTYNM